MNQFDGVVARMMAAYGGSALLHIAGEGGTYTDGEYIPNPSFNKPVKIILDEYPQYSLGEKSNFGTLVLEGDKRCLMQPVHKANPNDLPYEIKANKDTLIINGTEWKIVGMKQINPSGMDAIIFELHIRK